MFDEIASDPGSAFTSDLIKHLETYLRIPHKFSLVERHESNGCEGSIKQYLRHLRTIVHDENLKDRWGDDLVIGLINYHLMSFPTSETGGYTPCELKYGSRDAKYFRLPNTGNLTPDQRAHLFITNLDETLATIRGLSYKVQQEIAAERRREDGLVPKYMPGDFVLLDALAEKKARLPSKLSPPFLGPYEVQQQVKNDVEVKHVVMHTKHKYHVQRFKPFFGSYEDAIELAKIDKSQVYIVSINHCTGNPFLRSKMTFNITFEDGTIDRAYDHDLFETQQFEEYVNLHNWLFPLRYRAEDALKHIAKMRKLSITALKPGDHAYLNMRFFDFRAWTWYDEVGFPDKTKPYYARIKVAKWNNKNPKSPVRKQLLCHVETHGNLTIILDQYDIFAYVLTHDAKLFVLFLGVFSDKIGFFLVIRYISLPFSVSTVRLHDQRRSGCGRSRQERSQVGQIILKASKATTYLI